MGDSPYLGFDFMKVSIIIRAYNSEKTIKRALESALNQDFPKQDFEVIVIDDGSTDRTLKILKPYQKKIRLIKQKHQGAIKSANLGFRIAQGKYLILLDSDDYFEPNILRKTTAILDKNPKINFVYCDYYEKLKSGKVKAVSVKNIFQTLACTMMYRKKDLKETGFSKSLKLPEYDLLLKTQKKWRGYHIPKPLYHFNRGKGSLSKKKQWVKEALAELKRLHPQKIKEIQKIRNF